VVEVPVGVLAVVPEFDRVSVPLVVAAVLVEVPHTVESLQIAFVEQLALEVVVVL